MKIIQMIGGTDKYGPCERCGAIGGEIYHIFERDDDLADIFVCGECANKEQGKQN